ncbi:DsbA family protein [Deinococcus ficus]|uniref:DsbA family protein n=1 Tax=Deinococcus ficus TaxID=317577 RepID=UPI00174AA93A|nr:thioredoxin domain-containing protein [Deinococcus ficus]GHF74309.1 hypothetical protein GCM10017782_09990 [Deinococcus ficus]
MTRLKGSNSNNTTLVIGTLIAVVLIALALFAVRGKPRTGGDGTTATFNLADMPYVGQDDARVNVVVVEDFKCPACKNFNDNIEPELKTKYVDGGQVKWYTLVWPFISTQVARNPEDDSKYAAQAARCVREQQGNEGYEVFKGILFRSQGPESEVWASKANLKTLAGNVEGLDAAKFASCLDNDETLAAVEADKRQAEAAGVNSTPTVFVNGKKVEGTASAISQAIDEAVSAAN